MCKSRGGHICPQTRCWSCKNSSPGYEIPTQVLITSLVKLVNNLSSNKCLTLILLILLVDHK